MTKTRTAHEIAISSVKDRVRVIYNGITVADTTRALQLKEGALPPVYYIPREDAEASALERAEHRSYCPFKGEAAYFTLSANGKTAVNAVWSYEEPFPAVAGIRKYLAFYPSKVDAIEVEPATSGPEQGRV